MWVTWFAAEPVSDVKYRKYEETTLMFDINFFAVLQVASSKKYRAKYWDTWSPDIE